jgi:hypothetical protein
MNSTRSERANYSATTTSSTPTSEKGPPANRTRAAGRIPRNANANASTRRHAATFATQDKGFAALIRRCGTSSTRSRTNAVGANDDADS